MNKKLTISALLLALSAAAWGRSVEFTEESDDYSVGSALNAKMFVQGYEWGPAVPKVIVEFDGKVSGVNKDTFSVVTENTPRKVLAAYNSDKNGKKKNGATNYVAFDLEVKTVFVPFMNISFGEASPFAYDMETGRNDWAKSFQLELNLNDDASFKIGDNEFNKDNTFETFKTNLIDNYVVPETAAWKKDSYTHEGITLQRAAFTPKGADKDSVKNPLVIWLHGAGEGGKDIDIDLVGNEVVALSRKGELQKYFTTKKQKGAYVLAVQTPTMWMDKGDGTYNSDIDGEKQTSYYTEALFHAIKDYVQSNKDIDTSRIYIGGCSNGGYMTMNLMFEHGDFFTAFYPICEAYMNRNISDEMIQQIKDYNVWFVHSEDDTTVDPLATSIPSYYRLIDAGAKNVHYTLYENVRGTDDPEAVYMGHYSWVYAFNDQVKKEFDAKKAKADLKNVEIEHGEVKSKNNYVTNANCTKKANMWKWLAQQRK